MILRSLKFQIALAFFVVFMVISAIFSYYQFGQIKSILTNSFEEGLKVEGQSILARSSDNPFVIIPTTQDQQIQIWIEEIEGWNKLHETVDFPKEMENIWYDIEGTFPTNQSLIINYDTLSLFVSHETLLESSVTGRSVLFAKSNAGLNEEIEKVRLSLFGNNILAATISFLVAIILSNLLLKPIQRMVSKMSSIKAGSTMTRLKFKGASSEVDQLKNSFNEMIERIEDSIIKQNKFFDSASHELKTPLANMLAEIDYHLEITDTTKDLNVLKSLKSEVQRLSSLVNDFLLMSQLKNNELELHLQKVSLQDLVFDVLDKMNISIDQKGFKISFSIDEDITDEIKLDVNKMESIFYNILSNCLKYGDNVENIVIELGKKAGYRELRIQNKIDHNKSSLHGHQLGLWISQEISKKHGFELTTNQVKDNFIVSLRMPINAHSSLH